MQFERGRLEAGFMAFNHGDFGIVDYRVARAYALSQDFGFRSDDRFNLDIFSNNPNRDRDLHITNNVVSQAIAQAMHE